MENVGKNDRSGKGREENMKKNLLPVLTVASVVLGVAVGLVLRLSASSVWTKRELMYIQFPGDLFLQMTKAIVVPLVVSSMITALGSLNLTLSKKIAIRTLLYFGLSSPLAVAQGIIAVSIIQPGRKNMHTAPHSTHNRPTTTVDTLLDIVRNIFPPNLVESCFAQFRTILIPPSPPDNSTGNWTMPDIKEWKLSGENTRGSNVLGLIVFLVLLAISIGKLGEAGKPLLNLFTSLSESIMLLTHWILWLSPIGIFFLLVTKMLEAESFSAMVGQLGMYSFTVVIGLLSHGFIVLPSIYIICTKMMPFGFISDMGQAITTAFATASSSAAMPVSLNCLEEKIKIDRRVTRFVIPIGTILNKDGTALYKAVAVIFISQVRGMSLTLGQRVTVGVAGLLSSIAVGGIPQGGIVTMIMVLDSVGLPPEDISLILAVDWFLERCRTVINILSHALGAGIVDHLSKKELETIDKEATKI